MTAETTKVETQDAVYQYGMIRRGAQHYTGDPKPINITPMVN